MLKAGRSSLQPRKGLVAEVEAAATGGRDGDAAVGARGHCTGRRLHHQAWRIMRETESDDAWGVGVVLQVLGEPRATGDGVWPAGKDAGRGVVRARRRGPRVGVAPPAPALARTADALDHARGRRDGDNVLHHIFFLMAA